jgi:uncharacterized membrane protein YfcA
MFILFLIGIVAGLVEASAGGSGLISLPAILFLGYQPLEAIATSKFQYAFGAITAITRFSRAGIINWKKIAPMLLGATIAGGVGALILTTINTKIIALLVPILLIIVATYFLLSPRISDEETPSRISYKKFGIFVVPLIAIYDGFLGTGSASFYMTAFVLLLGMNVRVATASTKLLDFASGTAALTVLALKGHVLLLPGLALGAGQIIGSYFGASLVLRWGSRWVRPVIIVVTICLSTDFLIRHWEDLSQMLSNLNSRLFD